MTHGSAWWQKSSSWNWPHYVTGTSTSLSLFHSPGIKSGIYHLHVASRPRHHPVSAGEKEQERKHGKTNGTALCPEQLASKESDSLAKPRSSKGYLYLNQRVWNRESKSAETTTTTWAHAYVHLTKITTNSQILTLLRLGYTRSQKVTDLKLNTS